MQVDASSMMHRTARPSHSEYTEKMLCDAALIDVVTGTHKCMYEWDDAGEIVQCDHALWARSTANAIAALRKQRASFLERGSKARARVVLDALSFHTQSCVVKEEDGMPGWTNPYAQICFRVEIAPQRWREVCRSVFLSHYPVSPATLKRVIARKRLGSELYARAEQRMAEKQLTAKTLHAIAWYTSYANQVSEKLPDQDFIMTPYRYVKDIYEVRLNCAAHSPCTPLLVHSYNCARGCAMQEMIDDLKAAAVPSSEQCSLDWFC